MSKKRSIVTIFCLSLFMIAGCGKIPLRNGTSENLQKCQSVCDQQAVMYKNVIANYKSSCYSNCDKIEAMNQEKDVDGNQVDINTNGETTTTDGETTTTDGEFTNTDGEIMTDADCDKTCNSSVWLTTTAEERKGCALSCKGRIKIGSKDLDDCNDIETFSEGAITKDSCIATKALDQNNLEYCEKINDETIIASCYTSIAQENNDKSICNKIKNEENKAYCNIMFSQE